ncbi:heme-binding protein, partial [Enterobacter hormaechei]
MYINTSEAQKILQAAQAKAQQMGVKVSISVVDGRGDLL